MEKGKYIYCIIGCPEERSFEGAAPIGGDGGKVHTIPWGGLAAVASDSSKPEYDSTRVNLLAHERVQEGVMKEFTILPVRFGTVARSGRAAEQVLKLLETRHAEFSRLLSDMEGKVELGLKVMWRDEKSVLDEVLAESSSLRNLRDSMVGMPPEASHYDRIRLGELLKEALEKKKSSEAESLLGCLDRLAHRTVQNPSVVDRMVVNAAFLVARDRETEFDAAVAKLEQQLGQRALFKYVGPAPPYNFVNVTVNWRGM
ncbi:MAG: GvpL/GvpF family gas vesicle protein [Chloroflexi bacterium]|nr:GvpL/GvpF family gas vesicle protein [Chloroflexota bacterium]